MCGRYYIAPEEGVEELENIRKYIESRYGAEEAEKLASGEIFPSNYVPIVLTAESGFIAAPMTWGFPGFQGKQLLINARSETVEEKATFRESMLNNRCIVPTSGFYEWSHDPKGRAIDKFIIRAEQQRMLYLAGIYRVYEDGPRFVILTADSNATMSTIHHRQPVALSQGQLADYINDLDKARAIISSQNPSWVIEPAV